MAWRGCRMCGVLGGLVGGASAGQAGECVPAWAAGFGVDQTTFIQAFAVIGDEAGGQRLYASGSGSAVFERVGDGPWEELSGGGIVAEVRSLAVFDDGAGPALYATPEGGIIPGGSVKGVVRWTGSAWENQGAGLGGTTLGLCLQVFDDGDGAALYVGGSFDGAGGGPATSIARWDGRSWSGVGTLSTPGIHELAVFAGELYAGGNGITVDGATSNIARWDGARWEVLPPAPTGGVRAMVVHDDGGGPALYASGLGQTPLAPVVARFDGAGWTVVGEPFNGNIEDLGVFDDGAGAGPRLYAGGSFTQSQDGGPGLSRLAVWDGGAWQAVGGGTSGVVGALLPVEVDDSPALLVGGFFAEAGGLPSSNIALWEGCSGGPCPADLDASGGTDSADLNILLGGFGCVGPACSGDIDGDGDTDSADLNTLLAAFGQACG